MIKINNISKTYRGKTVLNNVSATFEKGTSTVIVGESGSGKTTLAKIIIGIEIQDKGEVLLEGKELKPLKKRDYKTCSQVQYIFQDPYSALESEDTINDVLEEPRRIAIRNGQQPMEIMEALKLVDEKLLEYQNQKVKVLSGGQRQKISIARALITNPKVIIADECTSMLDKQSSCELNQLLLKIVKQEKICLINISHEVDFHQDSWDYIIVIKDGFIVEKGQFKTFPNACKEEYSKALVDAFNYLGYDD